jgi:hypothetical protein
MKQSRQSFNLAAAQALLAHRKKALQFLQALTSERFKASGHRIYPPDPAPSVSGIIFLFRVTP